MTKQRQLKSKADLAAAAGVNRTTIYSWSKRSDFPDPGRNGAWNNAEWARYAKARQTEAVAAQTGKDVDLKRLKLEKQIKVLEIDIRKAEREDEIHKIEHEAKRGMWFHIDQIKEFAALVASAFDDSVAAVEMATRDAGAVKSVKESFDRIRARLADEIA